jgi:hypothetical protein
VSVLNDAEAQARSEIASTSVFGTLQQRDGCLPILISVALL